MTMYYVNYSESYMKSDVILSAIQLYLYRDYFATPLIFISGEFFIWRDYNDNIKRNNN